MTIGRRGAVAAVVTAAALVSGCGDGSTVQASTVVGPKTGALAVLIDTAAVPAVRCAMPPYLHGQPRGIKFGGGTADDIARTVKDGQPADVVIMPAGPALDRIRDELAVPPSAVTIAPARIYWVGAVNDKGLKFLRFLTGRAGRRILRSGTCAAGSDVLPSA